MEQGEVPRNAKRFRNAERFTSFGRNGAGNHEIRNRKSEIQNFVEVGTGFHPELTGRENIPDRIGIFDYLNGAMCDCGIRNADFRMGLIAPQSAIHNPQLGGGMYVRLPFAAHLEPEILLVDVEDPDPIGEVLAVGDAAFQKKCLGKSKIPNFGDEGCSERRSRDLVW